jgi:hypothetical protein
MDKHMDLRSFSANALLVVFFYIISFSTTSRVHDSEMSKKVDYFNELVFSSEFGGSNGKIVKWVKDINIFIEGDVPQHLSSELDLLITEINKLVKNIKIQRVDSLIDANYLIFLGRGADYAKIEPNLSSKIKNNLGAFWVYWNSDYEINYCSMYVDTYRVKNELEQKHILREEFTQSLGIMTDSYKYPKSIFYQKWTQTTSFTNFDKFVIRALYSDKIKPGMTKYIANIHLASARKLSDGYTKSRVCSKPPYAINACLMM